MLLEAAHDFVAWRTKAPLWRLKKGEAHVIATPAVDVLTHYGLNPSGEYGVWGNLITALALVYMPRIMAVVSGAVFDEPAPAAAEPFDILSLLGGLAGAPATQH